MTAPVGAGSGAGRQGVGRGVWIGGALLAVAVLAVVVLSGRQHSDIPFDIGSSQPAGYRALAILLRDRGATVASTEAGSIAEDRAGIRDVVVVADPDLMTVREYDEVTDAADRGALVVFGAQRSVGSGGPGGDEPLGSGRSAPDVSNRDLADTPAEPTSPGDCDIARLSGLGPIDTAFAGPVDATSGPTGGRRGTERRTCYTDSPGAFVTEERSGKGAIVTLGSPYLWANARLQPDKEHGGRPLDNAAVALRLLGRTTAGATVGTRITFVDPVATPGAAPNGTMSPIELMPVGVKLGIVQLLAAFAIYAWWRARRLGAVMVEPMPVEIAGSELVVAVGDLLRRKGSPQRAADVLRSDARRELARRLGVPPDAPTAATITAVAGRCVRDPAEVAAALGDGPVGSSEELVRLAATLSDIRQEVLTSVVR